MAIQHQRHKIRIRVMLFGEEGVDHVRVDYRADRRRHARRRPRRRMTIVRIPISPISPIPAPAPEPAPATKRTRWGSVFRTGLAVAASAATIARTLIEIFRHG
jgi:hypothetical protein